METPPGSPNPTATAQQLTEQVLILTNRFAGLETQLAESERLRQEQQREIESLRAAAGANNSGTAGSSAGPSSGPYAPGASSAPVVDTRVLGKPKPFKGTPAEWPNWSVVIKCYCGAMSPQMAALMEWAGSHVGECLNAALSQDQIHHSTQLYYILIMLVEGPALTRVINAGHGQGLNAWRALVAEYEPKSAARKVGDLVALLQFDFGKDIVVGFETFDRLINEYDRKSPIPLQDDVKVGTVLRNLADGPLKQHLLMSLDQLDTYDKLRNEVIRVRHAQMAAAGAPQPMDLSDVGNAGELDALGKGKGPRGRGRGGGRGGGQGGRGGGAGSPIVPSGNCHYCGKPNHFAANCPQKARDLARQQGGGKQPGGGGGGGKPKAKAKAKPQAFKGNCNRCGRPGHMKKDCRAKTHVSGKQLGSLEETEADQPEGEEPASGDFGGLFFNSFDSPPVAKVPGGEDHGGADWGDPDLLICDCCDPKPVIPPRVSTSKADTDILKATASLAALESEVITFAVDSGAAVTVIDPKKATSYPLLENAESRAGKTYRSAFGGTMPDLGTRALVGTVGSTGTVRGMKARVAKVVRPLLSVFEMVESGHRVVFDSDGSYAEHKTTGCKTPFRVRNRSYELDLNVVPHGKLNKKLQVKSLDLAAVQKDSDTNTSGGRRQRPSRV